jgi:hypothetical protein
MNMKNTKCWTAISFSILESFFATINFFLFLGGRIFWILFLHFLKRTHSLFIIQTPAQRFFCSTRVNQVKVVEHLWVNMPINERLQWRRRRREWRNNIRRSSREFYRMKCMHSILSKKEGGKKGLINGNGVSTNMAGDEEELTRS